MKKLQRNSFFLLVLFLMPNSEVSAQGSKYALYADSINQMIRIDSLSVLNYSRKVSFESWVSLKDSGMSAIFTKSDTNNHKFSLEYQNDSFYCYISDTGQAYGKVAITIPSDKWFHLAMVYNGLDTGNAGRLKLYINGVQSTLTYNGLIPDSIPNISAVFYLGKGFLGIDESRLWMDTLSLKNIRDYMCRHIDINHPSYSNLEGYWKMDEKNGLITYDSSGNVHNGTLIGNVGRLKSGAAIGNISTYLYPISWSGNTLVLTHPNGDSLEVKDATALFVDPEGVHIYRIDDTVNTYIKSNEVDSILDRHYWGVYASNANSTRMWINYYYSNYPYSGNELNLSMLHRDDNRGSWSSQMFVDTLYKRLTETFEPPSYGNWEIPGQTYPGEFVLGKTDTLPSFNLQFPFNEDTILVDSTVYQKMYFTWDSVQYGPPATSRKSKYHFFIYKDSISRLSLRDVSFPFQTFYNGNPQFLLEFDSANFNEVIKYVWNVKASYKGIIKAANNPYSVYFKRGEWPDDYLSVFTLRTPKSNDTIIVYNYSSEQFQFKWLSSFSNLKGDVIYKMYWYDKSGQASPPIDSFLSDSNGTENVKTFTHGQLAKYLADKGIPNNAYFEIKWNVLSSLYFLETESIQLNTLTLMRANWPPLGIPERTKKNFSVFPNPASNRITIRFNGKLNRLALIEVLDSKGEIIFNHSPSGEELIINVDVYPNGLYLIKLTTENYTEYEKVLIQHQR